MKLIGIGLTTLLLLTEFSIAEERSSSAEQGLRERLTTFLDKALDEFVKELGSSTHSWEFGSKRWEQPFVTEHLLLLARMESYRLAAFSEGLAYDRSDPPVLKPPTPRSFWLPISPEGSYSFKILSVSINERTAEASVEFTMRLDDETFREDPVQYKLVLVAEDWRIGNVVTSDGSDLVKFFQRRDIMSVSDRTEQQVGAGQPSKRSELDSEGGDKPKPESEGRSR